MLVIKSNIRYIVLCILVIFLFLNSNSQTYYRIPTDTNHYWRQFSACANGNSPTRYDYQIRYYKDTLINNQIYNKYARFGRGWGAACSSFIENGYLRQDTINKLVFILDHNWIERPLYDFSKNVGDTILHYDKAINSIIAATVSIIDTAYLFDGTKHKAFWTSKNNCFIEGVGSIFGGLYGDDQIFSDTVAASEQLICFGTIQPFFKVMEGITQTFYVCSFVSETVGVNQNENSETLKIKIFPNPIHDLLYYDLINQISTTFSIHNNLGEEVFTKNLVSKSGSIDLSFLPCGIYFLKLQSNSEQKIFKILKE